MRYRKLGRTGLAVSEICLGTMTFGGKGFWQAIGSLGAKEAEVLIGTAHDLSQEIFRRHAQFKAVVDDVLEQLAGRKRFGQRRLKACGLRDEFENGGLLIGRERERAALRDQWIVAVGLNQAHKGADVEVADARIEEDIVATVLVHVPIVAVALRVIFGGQREGVVVAFQIAVLARVEVIDFGTSVPPGAPPSLWLGYGVSGRSVGLRLHCIPLNMRPS